MSKRMIVILTVAVFALFSAIPAFAVPNSVSYSTTRDFLEVLDHDDIHYSYDGIDSDNDEKVTVGYNVADTSIRIRLFFEDDLESCSIRVWNFIDYEPHDEERVIKTIDELNRRYRWARFYTDPSDNSVTVAMDVIVRKYDAGEICSEAMHHVVNICDDAYSYLKGYNKNVG